MATPLTTAQLAARLGCSTDTVLRAVRDGSLPYHRIGKRTLRFDLDEVMRATAQQRAKVVEMERRRAASQLSPAAQRFYYGDSTGHSAQGGAAQSRTKRKAARSR